MNPAKPALAPVAPQDPLSLRDLTAEQRKLALNISKQLASAIQIALPFVYAERDGKRFYTLSGRRGAVQVDLVVTTDIPK